MIYKLGLMDYVFFIRRTAPCLSKIKQELTPPPKKVKITTVHIINLPSLDMISILY